MAFTLRKLTNLFSDTPDNADDPLVERSSVRTPDYIESIINNYNPNVFLSRKGYDKIDEMMTDDQVFSLIELKKYFCLSTGWTITEDADVKPEVHEFLEKNIYSLYDGVFNVDLYQILSSFEYGFSISELVFKREENKIVLSRIKTVPPHSVDFTTDRAGRISEIQQRQDGKTVILPRWKMLLYSHNSRFDQPYGISDLQRCYGPWFAKRVVMKFWNIYLQRFASPFPVAKVPQAFGTDKVNEMIKILDSIQQAVSIAIPADAEIELHKAGQSTGEYDLAIERYNQMIGRALLIPDLLGFGKSTGGGSYALGQTQYDLFIAHISFIRDLLSQMINRHVIQPLIDLNFGKQEYYPEFQFLPYRDENKEKMLTLFLDAIKSGMPIADADYNHFRKQIEFPELSEDEKAAAKTVKQPYPEQKMFSFAQNYRKPDRYEARIDFIAQEKIKEKIEDSTVSTIASMIKQSRDQLKSEVAKKKIVTDSDLKAVEGLNLKYKGEIKRALRDCLSDIYEAGTIEARADIEQIAKGQSRTVKFGKYDALNVSAEKSARLAQQLIDAASFRAVGKLTDDLLNRAKFAISDGIANGQNEREIALRIDQIFNEAVEGVASAGMSRNPSLINTIVRTNSTNIFNRSLKDTYTDPELQGFVEMYEYSALMDDRTSDVCMELDGFKARVDDPIWQSITPPNHFNCRSRLIPITEVDVQQDGVLPSEEKPKLEDLEELGAGDFIK